MTLIGEIRVPGKIPPTIDLRVICLQFCAPEIWAKYSWKQKEELLRAYART